MLSSVRVRISQGTQYIADLRKAVPNGFRGRPVISDAPCTEGCKACSEVCPTQAITLDPVRLDLARCVFCSECVVACPDKKFTFTPEVRMGARTTAALVVQEGVTQIPVVEKHPELARVFGRSLKLRQVSAGGCNACELELNALCNVNFDVQRFGIEWVASPRHADGLVLTGPITHNMREAVRLTWDAMSDPRFVIAVGACTLSGGLYQGATGVCRDFLDDTVPLLFVPGCPPHPLTFAQAILDFLGVEVTRL